MSTFKRVLAAVAVSMFMSVCANAQSDAVVLKSEDASDAEKTDQNPTGQKSSTTGTDNPNAAPAAATQTKDNKKQKSQKKKQNKTRHDTVKSATNNTRVIPETAPAGANAVTEPEPDAKAPMLPPAIQAPRAPIKPEKTEDKDGKAENDVVVKGSKIDEN